MSRSVLILPLILGLSACGQTSGSQPSMSVQGYAFSPPAFKSFCSREPRLCDSESGRRVVAMTGEKEAELTAVNRSVNRRIHPANDSVTSGRPDDWSLPSKAGDCEDYAILKKSELLKRGWPASALLLTVARYGSEGHTVLTVRTTAGDKILDNRTDAVRNWSQTPYDYFARQSQNARGRWERIVTAQPAA